jgi:hypothetical protein
MDCTVSRLLKKKGEENSSMRQEALGFPWNLPLLVVDGRLRHCSYLADWTESR